MSPSDEQTSPRPTFTDEDRARLRSYAASALSPGDTEAVLSMLAYITHLEGALEAADELARVLRIRHFRWSDMEAILNAYESTRASAALPTSKED